MALQPATSPKLDAEVHGLRARIAELEAWNHAAERAADALNRSGDAFRKIFDYSNDGILVIDASGERIVDANPRAMEMLGHDRATLLASPLSSLYPDDPERVRALTREVLERGTGTTREFDCRTPAGERRSTEISASMVELSTGAFVIALLRDVSDRRRAEERLQVVNARMRADLEAAVEMQRALLPDEPRPLPGIRAAWHVEPCERLGGDTLNVFALDRRRIGFFLLDVSGHGIKAAMLSVALQRVLCPYPHPGSVVVEPAHGRHGVPRVVSPRRVASRLNRLFPMDRSAGQYFTIVYGVLDVRKRELCFVSAGQGAPIVLPRGGEPEKI